MQQKYVYSYNSLFNFFRGLLPLPQRNARAITAYSQSSANLVWRNHFTWAYKVSQGYESQPMDLSNFVFIRTRERMLLENKVNAPQKVMNNGKASKLTGQVTEKSLNNVNEDLTKSISQLQNMLWVLQPQDATSKFPDLPVAFASNALYSLERNGAVNRSREAYERLLVPILTAKAGNLHAEGVSQAVWALANAGLT